MQAVADWLDVTFPPETVVAGWVSEWFASIGAGSGDRGVWLWRRGRATFQEARTWQRLSFSGGAMEQVRLLDGLATLCDGLSQFPHRITRLDAAYDVATEAAPVVRSLWKQYEGRDVYLTHKPVKPSARLGPNSEGVTTGTFYAGDRRKVEVTACVYDKQHEAAQRQVKMPPTLRYEIRVRTGAPVLADLWNPTAMFWHYASPALLPAPAGVPAWDGSGNPFAWRGEVPEPVPVADKLRRMVWDSEDLGRMVALADTVPDGRRLLAHLLRTRANQLDASLA